MFVGTTGFEPAASCTPCKRATGLRYVPNWTTIRLAAQKDYRLKTKNYELKTGLQMYMFL